MPSLPSGETPRASMIRAAVLLFASVAGAPSAEIEISVESNGTRFTATVTPAEAAAILGPRSVEGLTDLEAALYAVLTDRESKPAAIARRAGKNPHQHVYGALKSLVTKGYAARHPGGGYSRAFSA